MKVRSKLLPILACSLGITGLCSAANIASEGFGIIGVAQAIDSSNGTPWFQGGAIGNLNDGNLTTRLDTFNGGQSHVASHHFSYAGIVWGPARSDVITSLTLTMATFGDGGWFGVNNPSPAPAGGGALTAAQLIAPVVQVLGVGGWTTVPSVSNYLSQMTGHLIGGGAVPNPSSRDITFTLDSPVLGASGIRVIGSEGGTASNGFVGFFELNVQASAVPEPSSLVCGLLGLLGFTRRRR